MVKPATVCKILTPALLVAGSLYAQVAGDLERRVAELEQKMQLIDPAFGAENRAADLARRLEALESRMQELLPAQRPAMQPAPSPAQPSAAPITTVSVSSDYRASDRDETRLPVAGYMDFHVNRDSSRPFRPDFHRFVLLFGHGFSERIKFWSELELEHSFLEGGESPGEVG